MMSTNTLYEFGGRHFESHRRAEFPNALLFQPVIKKHLGRHSARNLETEDLQPIFCGRLR